MYIYTCTDHCLVACRISTGVLYDSIQIYSPMYHNNQNKIYAVTHLYKFTFNYIDTHLPMYIFHVSTYLSSPVFDNNMYFISSLVQLVVPNHRRSSATGHQSALLLYRWSPVGGVVLPLVASRQCSPGVGRQSLA